MTPRTAAHQGDSPGKNMRVGCHALLQGMFPTQGSNSGLLHCRRILYRLSRQGSPLSPGIGKYGRGSCPSEEGSGGAVHRLGPDIAGQLVSPASGPDGRSSSSLQTACRSSWDLGTRPGAWSWVAQQLVTRPWQCPSGEARGGPFRGTFSRTSSLWGIVWGS